MATLTPYEDAIGPMMAQMRARHAKERTLDPIEKLAMEAMQAMMEPCLLTMARARDRGQDRAEIADAFARAFASLIATTAGSLAGTQGPFGVATLHLILKAINDIALSGFQAVEPAVRAKVAETQPQGRA